MEVKLIIIAFLFISSSMLLSAAAMEMQKLPPVHQQGQAEMIRFVTQMPRKLRILKEKQEIINGGAKDSTTLSKEKKEATSAGVLKSEKEERMAVHGTWEERSDTSEFFTMDYSHVKRRRPIHNKNLPVAP